MASLCCGGHGACLPCRWRTLPQSTLACPPSLPKMQVDPASGAVVGWLRTGNLRARAVAAGEADVAAARAKGQQQPRAAAEVLNGIAYDADTGRLFVTGACAFLGRRPWVPGTQMLSALCVKARAGAGLGKPQLSFTVAHSPL